ncbi:MAG TPA: ABC transporter permease [Blastocatellia bacterium]|nr:ABC transporter permease [Blastocatellia bacterium]
MDDSKRKAQFRFWLWLIRVIGVIVPRRLRAGWRQEWEAELSYRETQLSEWDKLDWRVKLDLSWHSLGAFADALWLQPKRMEDEMFQDVRYGVRLMSQKPGFTLIAVFTLALGIGANTTIFSMVDASMLRPFNFPNQDRLALVWEKGQTGFIKGFVAPGNFNDWLEQSKSFERLVAIEQQPFDLTGMDYPERFNGSSVSTDFFDALGVGAALGRTFQPSDGEPGREQVVVLKHSLWGRRFAADPGIVGKTLTLNARTFTVIGVMPPDFNFPYNAVEMWAPIVFDAKVKFDRGEHFLQVLGTLKPGVSVTQADAEIDAISGRPQRLYPETNAKIGHFVIDMNRDYTRAGRMFLPVLMGMVGFVLLIACANVANMLLSRSVNRRKEIAVRLAIGASRWRLIRQLMTESLLLALAGGGLGLLLSVWAVNQLRSSIPEDFSKLVPGFDHLAVNQTALLFTLVVSMMTVALFGLLPALQASKPKLNEALKEGAKGASSAGSRRRLRNTLVVAEVAIALILLIGAGLMLRSFVAMASDEIGFNPHNALGFQVGLSEEKYTKEKRRVFFDQLLNGLQTLPGVLAVGAIHALPMTGEPSRTDFTIVGDPPFEKGKEPYSNVRIVTPGYFGAIGMPLKRGRDFNSQDGEKAAGAVIVNETFARRYFPNKELIGRRITANGEPDKPLEIVGVVGDVKNKLDEIAEPYIYCVYAQYPLSAMGIVMRTTADLAAISSALRRKVMELDPALPISNLKTVEQMVYERTTIKRVMTAMMSVFAVIALSLAGAGLYGVMAYAVSQRTHEIGVRLALGASQRDILRLIASQGLKLTLVGLAFGLVGAFALTRVMSGILFGVSAADPSTFILIPLLLSLVALLACHLPARRATKVDPMVALKCE